MAKPSRWTAEKRYQIVKEALSQREPMATSPGELGIRRQKGNKRCASLKVAGKTLNIAEKMVGRRRLELRTR
jgi:hypothetical protein